MAKSRKWSAGQKRRIAAMRAAGNSWPAIADTLGVTERTVRTSFDTDAPEFRNGVRHKPWSDEDTAVANALYDKGATHAVVARRLRRTRNSVIGYVRRHFETFPNAPRLVKPVLTTPARKPENAGRQTEARLKPGQRRAVLTEEAVPKRMRGDGPPPEPVAPSDPVAFVDLRTRGQCRFPMIAHGARADMHMPCCGATCDDGAVYCVAHARLVYAPREGRRAA